MAELYQPKFKIYLMWPAIIGFFIFVSFGLGKNKSLNDNYLIFIGIFLLVLGFAKHLYIYLNQVNQKITFNPDSSINFIKNNQVTSLFKSEFESSTIIKGSSLLGRSTGNNYEYLIIRHNRGRFVISNLFNNYEELKSKIVTDDTKTIYSLFHTFEAI